MSDRGLYIKFVESGIVGKIELYWQTAPVTARALYDALATPITIPASHAMFSGPEIMMGLPPSARSFDPLKLPPENQTIQPDPGELLWFYQPRNFFKIDPEEFWEIGLFYAAGGRTFGPTGWIPCTYFGRITEGLDAVAAECRKTRTHGLQTVELGQLS